MGLGIVNWSLADTTGRGRRSPPEVAPAGLQHGQGG